jgi:hypothetical protein
VKLYELDSGERVIADLFVNPDEPGLDPGQRQGPGTVDPASNQRLVDRLACCLDAWASGTGCSACEPQYACQ